MKSVQIVANGKIGFGDMPIQKPGPNQVLIKVHSAPINPSDILFMKGKYTGIKLKYPYTPGWEGSGTVVEVGPGMLSAYFAGKRVAFMKGSEPPPTYNLGGSMAEYIVTDIKSVIPLGDDLTLEEGSSHFVNPLTALGMVDRLKQLKVKAVIITAAASQLCRMIIKLCKTAGITPICTVRKVDQATFLTNELGCKYVINTSDKDWMKKMGAACMRLKPTGCLECISGEMTGQMCDFLGFGATVILYGTLSEKPAGGINTIAFIGKNLKLEGYLLSNDLAKMTLFQYVEFAMRAEPLMKGDLSTTIQKRFGLHQVREAIDYYQANQTAGKVILQPELTSGVPKL